MLRINAGSKKAYSFVLVGALTKREFESGGTRASGAVSGVMRFLRRLRGDHSAAPDSDRLLLERFVQRRDEDAFALLLDRHAAMVHGVCLRILRDVHEAEDAFQATFLVLARRAQAITWHE